jgi:hypothetical protein
MRLSGRIIIWTLAAILTGDTPVFSANLTVTSFSSYGGQTNIVRQATGNITFIGGSLSLPVSASPSQLVVQAGNNIIVDDGTGMVAGLLSLCFGDADGGCPPRRISPASLFKRAPIWLIGQLFIRPSQPTLRAGCCFKCHFEAILAVISTASSRNNRKLARLLRRISRTNSFQPPMDTDKHGLEIGIMDHCAPP